MNETPPQRHSVRVVDDSPVEADLVAGCLRDFVVDVMHDGATVLERMAAGQRPDLLIVDWRMPDLSGLDICRFLRREYSPSDLPVLVLTAFRGPGDAAECFEAGANDYVPKPCSSSELRARVVKELKVRDAVRTVAVRAEVDRAAGIEALEKALQLQKRIDLEQHLIGIVSHDLRGPLAVAILSTQMSLASKELPPRLEKNLQRIQTATTRASQMIKDLLDYSVARVGGVLRIDRQPLDLHAWVDEACAEVMLAHGREGLSVRKTGDARGAWDEARLTQLVGNLVTNAIVHGAPGRPVTVAIDGADDAVRLSVHNHGELIEECRIPNLFEPMVRGARAKAEERSIGLGLFIVKHIVEAHEGTIVVESTTSGTTFTAVLPRQAKADAQ